MFYRIHPSLRLFSWRKLARLSWFLVFLAALLAVVWYQFTGLKLHFFHESAFPLLYAETNLDTVTFFSGRFSGREISPASWPAIGSLLMLLGGKVSIGTHSVYALSFTLFVLLVGTIFCKVAKFSYFTGILFLTTVFIAFGPIPSQYQWLDQVWIWPMNSYGVYDFFSLACFVIVLKLFEDKTSGPDSSDILKQKTFRNWLLLAMGVFFLFSLNSVRGFLVILGGVIFSLVFEKLVKPAPFAKAERKDWGIIVALVVASLAGLLLVKATTAGIPQYWQDPHKMATISNGNDFRDRLNSMPFTWLTLFNAIPAQGKSIFSHENIVCLSNTMLATVLLLIPLFRLNTVARQSDGMARAETLMTYRLLFILVMLLIATLYGTSAGTPRYLLPLAYSALFVFPFYIEAWLKEKRYGLIAIVVALLAPAYINSIVELTKYSPRDYKENKFYRMAKVLESEGLTFGYAGPYETNALTINHFSGGKVRVALVDPHNNTLQPHRHADKQWYRNEYHHGRTFVALPANLATSNEKNKKLRTAAIKTISFEDWLIDVYPANIADSLDNKFEAPVVKALPAVIKDGPFEIGGNCSLDVVNNTKVGAALEVAVKRADGLGIDGWAIDEAGDTVPELVAMQLTKGKNRYYALLNRHGGRDDVAKMFARPEFANAAYDARLEIGSLPAGQYEISIIQKSQGKNLTCSTNRKLNLKD